MKIAFVNQSIRGGGAERATVNLANRLSVLPDMQVYLITCKREDNEYSLASEVQRKCILTQQLQADFSALRKVLIEEDIDIAVGMGIYANFCVCLANHNIKTKMLISERNSPAHDHISTKSKILRFLVYRRADAYVFQTRQARAFYSKSIQKRGVVIHNPVKCDLPEKTTENKKEIVAAGRLMPQKNYKMLLRAMRKVCDVHPEYKLRVFGEGSELEELRMTVAELDLEGVVKFEGFSLNVHEQIKDSSIFVMSSDFEGMPNSLMEAMAMGFPVVTTDCPSGGPAELIQNYENGILVPVGDSDKMAEEIIHVIEDKALASKIAQNASTIRVTHSDEKILQLWIDLFQKVGASK